MNPTPVAGKFYATVPETTAEICLTNLTETLGETPCVRKIHIIIIIIINIKRLGFVHVQIEILKNCM